MTMKEKRKKSLSWFKLFGGLVKEICGTIFNIILRNIFVFSFHRLAKIPRKLPRTSLSRGDLLRSVQLIKFCVKTIHHWYLGHFQWFAFIYSPNWRNNWRSLLFKLQSLFLPLSKFICHTVTFSFMHITGVVWPMIHSFCFGIITNIIKNLLHILDFTSVCK